MRLFAPLLLIAATGCSSDPRTALRLTVTFDAALALDQLRVRVSPAGLERVAPDPPAPLASGVRLVILVPDEWADTAVDLAVSGLAAGKEAARGQVQGTPRRDAVVDLAVTLGTACVGSCTSGERRCQGTSYQVCDQSSGGCPDWGPLVACGGTQTCRASDAQCVGCATAPSCAGKACGDDDGCGGKCQTGTCGANAMCKTGSCACDGASCGTVCCAPGEGCTSPGKCEKPTQIMVVALDGTFTAKLGDIAGADAMCQTAAGTAGMPGKWKALLCRTAWYGLPADQNLSSLFTGATAQLPVVNKNGQVLYGSWAAMFGCSGSGGSPAWSSGVSLLTFSGKAASGWAWTGCNCDGSAADESCCNFNGCALDEGNATFASWSARQLVYYYGRTRTMYACTGSLSLGCVRISP